MIKLMIDETVATKINMFNSQWNCRLYTSIPTSLFVGNNRKKSKAKNTVTLIFS